jgi:protein-S-isoprenylcysteine O-methyltransferase Ste14
MVRIPSQRALELLSRWRVDVAWIGVIMIVFAHPTTGSIAAFLPLVAVGLLLRLWARGHLERGVPITQTGPYAYVRHPLYVGSFLLGLAFALMSRSLPLVAVYLTCFLVMYVPKALREEAYLRTMAGPTYDDYAARTGAMLPRMRRAGAAPAVPSRTFEWRRVRRHREWRTWVGVLVLLAAVWQRAAGYVPFP